MVTLELDTLPARLRPLAKAAAGVGWTVTATTADGPPSTVALRFAHDDYRCYGVWALVENAKGAPGIKWRGGAARHVPPGPLDTLASLRTYLGLAA